MFHGDASSDVEPFSFLGVFSESKRISPPQHFPNFFDRISNTMTVEPPPIDALVIDAGPIIKNSFTTEILSRVSKVYTTPSVIAEIRDPATRSRLETTWLTFINQRTPKAASVKVVSEFARKTGDFPVLSVTDLQLLALTYELEVELNGGDWRLKSVPGQKRVNGPVPKKKKKKKKKKKGELAEGLSGVEGGTETVGGKSEAVGTKDSQAVGSVEEDIAQTLENTHILSGPDFSEPAQQESPTAEEESQLVGQVTATNATIPDSNSDPDLDSDSDSDSDGGWITPSNLHKYQAKENQALTTTSSTKERFPIRSALATTDFALQNVLLQMNLHLLSPTSLHRIKEIKSFVLRCHACFKLTRDMTKQFCPTCGGPTLQRIGCSTSSTGEFKLHLKRGYQWNNRGNVYSLPKPQHGSASGKGVKNNLILREDQKEYEREVKKEQRRKERNLLDPDYLPGILTGERRDTTGKPTIGYGGSNPNARKRGGKR